MAVFSTYCAGAAHIASGLPVQDRAKALDTTLPDGRAASLLALADGHGDPCHFRSDTGAAIAIETAIELMPGLLTALGEAAEGTARFAGEAGGTPANAIDCVFRTFFTELCRRWCAGILEHWRKEPPADGTEAPSGIARAYGCTLLGAARAGALWFAFQVGDGGIVALGDDEADRAPVPGDPRCHGNITTSMSSCGASDFRYAGGKRVPAALMLCSDGLSGCYDSLEELAADFLGSVADNVCDEGFAATCAGIEELLPRLSAESTRDDMSLALWLDEASADAIAALARPDLSAKYRADRAMAAGELAETDKALDELLAEIARLDPQCAERIRKQAVADTLARQRAGLLEELNYYDSLLKRL